MARALVACGLVDRAGRRPLWIVSSAIMIGADASDWRAAVTLAAGALAASGAAKPGYAAEMIRMIEERLARSLVVMSKAREV